MTDNRTSEQVEDVADVLWEQSEATAYTEYAETLRQEAIYSMLRAILIELRHINPKRKEQG